MKAADPTNGADPETVSDKTESAGVRGADLAETATAAPTGTPGALPTAFPTAAPTAAMLLIGNELLSGRTQDANLAYVGERLAAHGIRMREARIVPDIPAAIIEALNVLRARYDYVFTSGGIGPTHDDITADCVAEAFSVALPIHPGAEAELQSYWRERDVTPNAARLRMARIPSGASLIRNTVSAAPGFQLENVFVMAGVPKIMQAMFDSVLSGLVPGPTIISVSVTCDLGEGALAEPLGALQGKYPEVDIGSYPGGSISGTLRVMLVARGTDAHELATVQSALEAMIARLGGSVID